MLGIDVVDIERLRAALARCPELHERLFTSVERSYCVGWADPVMHLAGTLAAKEAVMKSLGLSSLPAWARRVEIARDSGGPRAVVAALNLDVPVSISHDGGVAVAVALRLPSNGLG